jgi:lipopolysaccharide transport system permease protein
VIVDPEQTLLSKLEFPRNRGKVTDTTVIRIQPSRRWPSLDFRELWSYRELLYFLVWRDVKVRYKQSALGAAWAILQPLVTMVIFTLIFKNLADMPSDGLPYSIFAYTALLPWNLFAGALNRCVISLVGQANMISKVYFPRLLVPFAATVSGVVDFAIAFVLLIVMMLWFGVLPTWGLLLLPVFILLALIAALSVGLWLSAINVQYRDVGHAIPFFVQLWMFASPVAYPVSEIPEKWRLIYSLNPMAGVIEGFRWALLGKEQPDLGVIAITSIVTAILFFGGIIYFKRMEDTFADVV